MGHVGGLSAFASDVERIVVNQTNPDPALGDDRFEYLGGAAGGVGPALAQPGHQHVAGAGGDGQQRMVAPRAGVAVVAGALLVQTVGLADGGVQVDGQGRVAGAAQARASNSRFTRSSWRTWPHLKLRRKATRACPRESGGWREL